MFILIDFGFLFRYHIIGDWLMLSFQLFFSKWQTKFLGGSGCKEVGKLVLQEQGDERWALSPVSKSGKQKQRQLTEVLCNHHYFFCKSSQPPGLRIVLVYTEIWRGQLSAGGVKLQLEWVGLSLSHPQLTDKFCPSHFLNLKVRLCQVQVRLCT